MVLGACADNTGKSITAPVEARNSTTFGDPGVFANAAVIKVCVDASSPPGTYRFTDTNTNSGYALDGTTPDGADGGDGVTTPTVPDGTEYTVGVGACNTVLTRTTPDSFYPTYSDTQSATTITATTIPGGAIYLSTNCNLDAGATPATPNPCGTGNNPTRAYANIQHGSEIVFFFGAAPSSTGQIAPTATTCQDYANGTSPTLSNILVGFKGTKANSISPGVFFYYARVTKTAGQTVGFTQLTNPNPANLPLYVVQQTQAYLYNLSCSNVATLTLGAGGTTASGGTSLPAGNYILGVKFATDAPKGTIVPSGLTASGSLLATHRYEATAGGVLVGTTTASVNTRAK